MFCMLENYFFLANPLTWQDIFVSPFIPKPTNYHPYIYIMLVWENAYPPPCKYSFEYISIYYVLYLLENFKSGVDNNSWTAFDVSPIKVSVSLSFLYVNLLVESLGKSSCSLNFPHAWIYSLPQLTPTPLRLLQRSPSCVPKGPKPIPKSSIYTPLMHY